MSNITKAKRKKLIEALLREIDPYQFDCYLEGNRPIKDLDAIAKQILNPGIRASSAKGKGRKAQDWLRDRAREYLTYHFDMADPDYIKSTPMGMSGEDLQISPHARRQFPFAPECKNQEQIGFWPAVAQAMANAGKNIPLILFMKNHTKPWIAIPGDVFFAILDALASDGMLKYPRDAEWTTKKQIEYAKDQIQERQA